MVEKRSKYDTDPLDPDFVRRTEEVSGPTREIRNDGLRMADDATRRSTFADAPTRRYDQSLEASYPSMFAATQVEAVKPLGNSSSVPPLAAAPISSRQVQKINLPENVACALPYAPFYIGFVIGLIELYILPRSEVQTRFHAAQAVALHVAIAAAGLLLRMAYFLTSRTMGQVPSLMLWMFWSFLSIAALIYLIYLMVRIWKGTNEILPPLSEATKWLNERIEPRRS